MNKPLFTVLSVVGAVLSSTSLVSAHVIVTPNQVGIAAIQTFSMSVPSEKDGLTTTNVRLVLPASLHQVSPTV